MDKKLYKKLEANTNLVNFVNKILTYNAIFENEVARSMLFVSLISSDSLIDEHACDETIETAQFILTNIDLFVLHEDIKKFVIEYSKKAIKIAKRDKKEFEKLNNKQK